MTELSPTASPASLAPSLAGLRVEPVLVRAGELEKRLLL